MSFIVPAKARSWVQVDSESHFSIQNLPFCSIETASGNRGVAVRIGDFVLDLSQLAVVGLLDNQDHYFTDLYAMTPTDLRDLRKTVYDLLEENNPELRDNDYLCSKALLPIDEYVPSLPMDVGCFVDFYSGINHASNVGRMFRPDQPPLLPNYRHLPVGYNGRASSVVSSGHTIVRPNGQTKGAQDAAPSFGPSKELDFELEMGFFTGKSNPMGSPIPIGQAADYMLGVVLVNDWSARDIQRWEYQPLGPFLAKSFATSVSPWLVTLDALEPFRVTGIEQDPPVLPYLRPDGPSHYDIQLEVKLKTAKMTTPQTICRTNAKNLYWSFTQQLAHQTCNGTPIQQGDLYASGTISGTEPDSFGSLLELTWRGEKPLTMTETGETRTFLEDGDTLTLSGWCQGDGFRVGFGEVSGTIGPAIRYP